MEITVDELRNALRNVPGNVVVCACIPEYPYAPIVEAKFEAPTNPGEGEIGVFLLMPDPTSEAVRGALAGT